MPTLIRAIEVWVPDRDGYLLEFGDGLYGGAVEFEAVSRELVFGRREGLPGRVWEEGCPVLLTPLDGAGFRRAKAAKKAGYAAAVALPYHVHGDLHAVVVFFFGFAASASAAVQLWRRTLGVDEWVAGYYGTSDDTSDTPVRAPARAPDLTLACAGADGERYVLTLAGGPALPIAAGVQRWTSDLSGARRIEGASASTSVDEALVAEAFACALPRVGPDGTIVLPLVHDDVVSEAVVLSLPTTSAVA